MAFPECACAHTVVRIPSCALCVACNDAIVDEDILYVPPGNTYHEKCYVSTIAKRDRHIDGLCGMCHATDTAAKDSIAHAMRYIVSESSVPRAHAVGPHALRMHLVGPEALAMRTNPKQFLTPEALRRRVRLVFVARTTNTTTAERLRHYFSDCRYVQENMAKWFGVTTAAGSVGDYRVHVFLTGDFLGAAYYISVDATASDTDESRQSVYAQVTEVASQIMLRVQTDACSGEDAILGEISRTAHASVANGAGRGETELFRHAAEFSHAAVREGHLFVDNVANDGVRYCSVAGAAPQLPTMPLVLAGVLPPDYVRALGVVAMSPANCMLFPGSGPAVRD